MWVLLIQIQLVRIQLRVPEYGWTTQKVFHFLNFLVNGGLFTDMSNALEIAALSGLILGFFTLFLDILVNILQFVLWFLCFEEMFRSFIRRLITILNSCLTTFIS